MLDPETSKNSPATPAAADTGGLFTPPTSRDRGLSPTTWVIAGLAVLALLGALLFAGSRNASPAATKPLPLDPYAATLPLSDLKMSESESLSGGKSTFIDGHIHNTGTVTVTAVTVQVFFRNEEGMPPAIETLSLPVVRTREPYVDTQPIAAAPIKPGEDREFRLIFETIPGNWNVQLPEIHVVHVRAR